MNDMSEKYNAVVVSTHYDREKNTAEFICEYEKDGQTKTVSFTGSPSMVIDEGSHVELTIENDKVVATNTGSIIKANSIFMLICLFIFIAAIVLLFIWFVKTRYTGVRIGIAVLAAAFIIITHIPITPRKGK